MRVHGQSRFLQAKSCDGLSLTFWVLTEINGRPLNLFFKENEIRDRLNAVGRDISILVCCYWSVEVQLVRYCFFNNIFICTGTTSGFGNQAEKAAQISTWPQGFYCAISNSYRPTTCLCSLRNATEMKQGSTITHLCFILENIRQVSRTYSTGEV